MIIDQRINIIGHMSNRNDLNAFLERLDAWMKLRGMNDRTLSLAAGLDASFVNKVRNRKKGRPRVENIKKLADAMGISPFDLDPEAPLPDAAAIGAADKARDWEDAAPSRRTAAIVISGTQFRDVFVPLVRRIAGDAAADRIAKKDHAKQAALVMRILAEDDDGLSVTSRLTQYLLTAAAAASSIPPDDPRYDYPHWRDRAEKAAAYLLALGSEGARKSG